MNALPRDACGDFEQYEVYCSSDSSGRGGSCPRILGTDDSENNGERRLPNLMRPSLVPGRSSERQRILQMMTKTKLPGPLKQQWHAVSVVARSVACPAIEALRDKRFLSDEAPPLPHPECSSPWRCKCVYLHHSDRRAIRRRATDRGRFPNPWVGKERREGLKARGRRADD
jgi:hypothetical protein